MLHEDLRLRGELHPPAGLAEQLDADLALELGQLLRHRGRALMQRHRHRGDGAADAQLTQQAQPPDIQHQQLQS